MQSKELDSLTVNVDGISTWKTLLMSDELNSLASGRSTMSDEILIRARLAGRLPRVKVQFQRARLAAAPVNGAAFCGWLLSEYELDSDPLPNRGPDFMFLQTNEDYDKTIVASAHIGLPPDAFRVRFTNDTGQTLAPSGNSLWLIMEDEVAD